MFYNTDKVTKCLLQILSHAALVDQICKFYKRKIASAKKIKQTQSDAKWPRGYKIMTQKSNKLSEDGEQRCLC